MAESMVQYGRRRGSSPMVSSDGDCHGTKPLLDLRQVTVLPREEYLKIKESLNHQSNHKKRIEEAAKQREAMHQQSKEVVKLWSNTIVGQRQKKIEAKKIREELEEEQRKARDLEEARYQEQLRKEAIARAKAQLYYQTQQVKGFHSALLLTEVLKEREAQLELKRRIESSSKDRDREVLDKIKSREDEALEREKQKAVQKKLNTQAVAEDLRTQMRNVELARAREKLENVKEGEEIQRLRQLHLREQSATRQRQEERKKSTMQAHLEHISNRDVVRGIDERKRALEEEQRELFLATKKKMGVLRKEKEAELFREAQILKDMIRNKLTATQQEKTDHEDECIARAIAEQEAREALRRNADEERKAAMQKSISEHRETLRLEQEQKEMIARQKALEVQQAKEETARIFLEKQQQKAQKAKEEGRFLQDHYVQQMAAKQVRHKQKKTEQRESLVKNTELIVAEGQQFQQYASQVIREAAVGQRNLLPLHKAAREGLGGGLGPVFGGAQPSYLVQDDSGVEMPRYVCGTTQNVKELNETTDMEGARKRLGFTW
ncbi:coiled-coil domain-containing protein 173 [Gadus morhua]|uniref:Cilia and flagella associated protein 210 n=1 Tax=Gadus morhua TaxID=8049 RepID=A0A8C4YY96_GADMO|nr:coiled-coil domain-containing protein 173 [Gadus morhua]